MLVFIHYAQRRSVSAKASNQIAARIKKQEHIAASVRMSCTLRRISFRQFDRDAPLLPLTLRFVGTGRHYVAAHFRVTLRGKDGRCRVGDCAGFRGSGDTDGKCCEGSEKLVGLFHDGLNDVFERAAPLPEERGR